MASAPEEAVERELRAQLASGAVATAATTALRHYGPDVFGYLRAVLRDEQRAAEAFSDVCAAVWTDLASFDGPSVRAWILVIARHRVLRAGRAAARDRRNQPLSRSPELRALADQIRTATPPWRRTGEKDHVARLRERLEPDEQTLLILRVDRALPWNEIATVMEVAEATARKRYERLIERLRKEARASGLIR